MLLINVSLEKNGVYQTRLYKLSKDRETWPADIPSHVEKSGATFIGMNIATADDMRPGKPVIEL